MGRAFEFRKSRKIKRWSSMAKIFTKIVKEITICAKEGGTDTKTNSKLRALIQNAKSANMPKENIKRALVTGAIKAFLKACLKITVENPTPLALASLIYSESNISNIEDLVSLINAAAAPHPRAIHGKI